jgi:hypothetical protein
VTVAVGVVLVLARALFEQLLDTDSDARPGVESGKSRVPVGNG